MNKKQFREGGIISRIIPKIKTSLPGLEGKEIFESNPQFVNEGYSGGKMKRKAKDTFGKPDIMIPMSSRLYKKYNELRKTNKPSLFYRFLGWVKKIFK